VNDIIVPAEGRAYALSVPVEGESGAAHSRLELTVVGLDPFGQRATLRVAGSQLCRPECASTTQVVFFSLPPAGEPTTGMPPSAAITLPANSTVVSKELELPVYGYPVRYPFDTYRLVLGTAVLRGQADGALVPVSATEAVDNVTLSL